MTVVHTEEKSKCLMSQLIHVEVVKLWAVKLMMMYLQAIFSFFNNSKGSYSEPLSVAIKIVL